MKHGRWVPVSKNFTSYLPKDRPYSKVEAGFSLQLDFDNENPVTVAGYADLWGWSRKKVRLFFKQMGIEIIYPEDTRKKQNQKGQIGVQIRDRSDGKKGQIRLIDSKGIQAERDRSGEKKGQIRDRSGNSTIEPKEPKPKNSCPQQRIVDLYHAKLSELPKVRIWTDTRQTALRSRWNEAHENDNGFKSNSLEWWSGFFEYISKSDFLMGRVDPPPRKRPFKPNLEWIVTRSNFVKIIEGTYH